MNKPSYHQRILDAPYPDIDYRNLGEELAYKVGCNAMRDVATGLASEADATISNLVRALQDVSDTLHPKYEDTIQMRQYIKAAIDQATLASLPTAEL